jgi:hypothetical protein
MGVAGAVRVGQMPVQEIQLLARALLVAVAVAAAILSEGHSRQECCAGKVIVLVVG